MIVHLLTKADWLAAQSQGEYRPPSLANEGFIHCSRPAQVDTVARLFYRGVPDLLLLHIDPARVRPEIRWEPPSGGELPGQTFPHLYGPLNLNAVVSVEPYRFDSEA